MTAAIGWLPTSSRSTHRLRAWAEALLALMPIRHVSRLTGLHWHSIKAIDKRRLQQQFDPLEPSDVRRLAMDAFALHKGHRYATVIMDAERTRVLWVAMDMNTAFDLEVKQQCPQAEVVYDLFHVVARFGRDVIDRIRVDQANALKHDQPER